MFHRDILVAPNGQKAWSDFYLVSVTHPDKPNFSQNRRSRTTHYALANKVKSKSLCNMTVSEIHRESIDVRTADSFSAIGVKAGCIPCTERAIKLIKEWKSEDKPDVR
jgi:hypothetical protein